MQDDAELDKGSTRKKTQVKKKRDKMLEQQSDCDDCDVLVSAKKAKENKVIGEEAAKLEKGAMKTKKDKNTKRKNNKALEEERDEAAELGADAMREKKEKKKKKRRVQDPEEEVADVKKDDTITGTRHVEENEVDEAKAVGTPDKKRKKRRRDSETGLQTVDGGSKTGEDVLSCDPAEKSIEPNCATTAQSLTVFVGGIPFSIDDEAFQADFEECGKVADVKLIKDDWGRNRGFGYITYDDEAGVLNALRYDGEDYGGRTLKVERTGNRVDKSKTGFLDHGGHLEVFVTGLPADTSEETLRQKFTACGDIKRLNLPLRSTGNCKGFAWISFEAEESMKKALLLNGQGRSKLTVEAAGQHRQADGAQAGKSNHQGKSKGKGRHAGSGGHEVFVSNLPYETTEADLRRDFGECGEITRMHVPVKAGRCMGFAWITYKTTDGLDEALTYHLSDYGTRRLRVEKAGQHLADKGGGKGKT